jgi:streptogramin lyase
VANRAAIVAMPPESFDKHIRAKHRSGFRSIKGAEFVMRTRRNRHFGRQIRCRPLVEGLESRQLLAVTFQTHYLPNPELPLSYIPNGSIASSLTVGPDQNVWFTTPDLGVGNLGQAATTGVINSTTGITTITPTGADETGINSRPDSIVSGPGGDLWFIGDNDSNTVSNIIASINPTTGATTNFPVLIPGANLASLAVGSDGNLWFSDKANGAIGMFNPTTHTSTEFPLPRVRDTPGLITPGPNGDLFFTAFIGESSSYAIGEINPTTQAITMTSLPNGQAIPIAITAGPDGNVWFNEQIGTGFKIGMLDPTTDVITDFAGGSSGGITTGPDGNLWYDGQGMLTEFDPSTHVATSFPLPAGVSVPGQVEFPTGGTTIVSSPGNTLSFIAQNFIVTAQIIPATSGAISGTVTNDSTGSGTSTNPHNYQTVYLDLNNDGTLDPGDPTALTDDVGTYSFTGLAAGTYTVRVDTLPGTIVTFPGGGSQTVTVANGQVATPGPFGIIASSSLLPLSFSANPFGTANPDVQTAEVNAVYWNILGRAPDPTGGANAVAYLKSGGSLVQLAGDLMTSPEYDGDTVQSFYHNYLDRAPTTAELSAGVSFLEGGGTQNQLATQIFNSAEFSTLFASDTAFVQQLYVDILGRQAEPAGLALWVNLLSTGTTRADVVSQFINSVEADTRAVNGQVNIIQASLIDGSDETYIKFLQGGATQIDLAVIFFSNSEFVARANATVV